MHDVVYIDAVLDGIFHNNEPNEVMFQHDGGMVGWWDGGIH